MIPKYSDIVDLIKKGSTVEAQEKIMELREAAIELQEENLDLKQKVSKLEELVNKKKSMGFRAPFYYVEDDEIPFCPRCWEVENKAVHFPPPFNSSRGLSYTCVECNSNINPDR